MARTRSRYLSTTIGVTARASTTVISPAANRSSAVRSSPFLPATTIARMPGNDASGSTPNGLTGPRPRAANSDPADGIDAGGTGACAVVTALDAGGVDGGGAAAGGATGVAAGVVCGGGTLTVAAGTSGAGPASDGVGWPLIKAQAPITASTTTAAAIGTIGNRRSLEAAGDAPAAGSGPATIPARVSARGVGGSVSAVAAAMDA